MAYEFVDPYLRPGRESHVSVPLDFDKNLIVNTLLGSCFYIAYNSLVRRPNHDLVIDTFDKIWQPGVNNPNNADAPDPIPTMRIEDADDRRLRGFFVDIRYHTKLYLPVVRTLEQDEKFGAIPLLGLVYSPDADTVAIVSPERRNERLMSHVLRLMAFTDESQQNNHASDVPAQEVIDAKVGATTAEGDSNA
jgi:hypothetical protein